MWPRLYLIIPVACKEAAAADTLVRLTAIISASNSCVTATFIPTRSFIRRIHLDTRC
ncbi:MAG: hypothetical protein QOJ84_1209 [Bradyrhizobium sp.]|nr:hypothetical protein [Bradyrhizobium sp.]